MRRLYDECLDKVKVDEEGKKMHHEQDVPTMQEEKPVGEKDEKKET